MKVTAYTIVVLHPHAASLFPYTTSQVVFRKEGSYIADLLVEELAATINALSREAAIELSRLVLTSAATTTSRQAVAALGPLRPFVAPFPLPSEVTAQRMPRSASLLRCSAVARAVRAPCARCG